MKKIFIKDKKYTIEEVFEAISKKPIIQLDEKVKNIILESNKVVNSILDSSEVVYGINTGFGKLSQVKIPKDKLIELQENLILSHSVGLGDPVDDEIVWTMLFIKIISLSKGYSGVSIKLMEKMIELLNSGFLPIIPSQGSVGASGDLAPLAHMALPLIGQGKVRKCNEVFLSEKIFKKHYQLKAKEGLAIINGTQFSTALAIVGLAKIDRLIKIADIVSALSLEGMMGTDTAFRKDVQSVKIHKGQYNVAENLRFLLKNSEIHDSHKGCDRVQDMYSLRCIPQVHGASREMLVKVFQIIENELNSVSDNPIVLPDKNEIISAGHFHAEIVAQALDTAAIAVSSFATISERRIYSLIDGKFGLPPFLTDNPGINSGYMMLQVTAASIVSENKTLCHPASVDSIPTGAGQEDHVSMAPWSGRKLLEVIKNTEKVLAIELLMAIQSLYFRKGLNPGKELMNLFKYIKKHLKHNNKDKLFDSELRFSIDLIESGKILNYISNKIK